MAKEIESANTINLISNGTKVKGDVESSSGIRIDGTLNGKMNIKGKVVVGNPGKVEADIFCQTIEVSGNVIGNIHAKELVTLKSTAHIQGEIVTRKLSIEPGAVFTGSCKMDGNTDGKTSEKPQK